MRLGRNDPCWCGSGAKFKHCHLGRESQQRVSHWDSAQLVRKHFSVAKCLHPAASDQSCRGGIVQAHTIRRSADLAQIARSGHVYGVIPDFSELVKHNGRWKPKLVGIRRASTFTGFCAEHDSSLFAPIEVAELGCTPEQAHRLLYRPVARELYAKIALSQSVPVLREGDRGLSVPQQISMQSSLHGFDRGIDAAIRELTSLKRDLDADYLAADYSKICAVEFELDAVPDCMCAGVTQPDYDFQGVQLQDLSQTEPPALNIGFSLLASGGAGKAIFVWRGNDHEPAKCLVRSLQRLPIDRIPPALLRFAVESFENLYMRPQWWESLKPEERAILIRRISSGLPFITDGNSQLAEDGKTLVNWRVKGIREIGECGLTQQ